MAGKSAKTIRRLLGGSALAMIWAAGAAMAQDAPIIQPGAPGQSVRTLSADEADRIAANRFTADDVRFMQEMILHHQQAVEMSALVAGRTNNPAIIDIARRITASQEDEIGFMRDWLLERGQAAPDPTDPHAAHSLGHHGHAMMAGMATPEQMAALAAASGPAFDQMFLQRMIAHHEGALIMVADLLARRGSGYDPVLFRFVNDVRNEQEGEIVRMSAQVRALSDDPRPTLKAGFRDAGEAIKNLTLVASLPKPTGFFDRDNPAGLPLSADPAPGAGRGAGTRAPLLNFSNTDMAFAGDLLAVGNYHGFNLYRLGQGAPQLISSVVCPGGQGDVSIVGDLLLMSVEATNGRVDCGREGVREDVSPERFRGLRIFNIANPLAPVQVGQVQTCRGSHTHSVVSGPGPEGVLVVYNSGTAGIRDERELAGCIGEVPGDDRTALFRIDVIEIPLADPSRSRIVDSPTVFADGAVIAGLWRGGDHGEGTQTTRRTDHCHDITVFPSLNLAAGACSGNGVIFDITDPRAPKRIDAVVDQGFAYWHSATFNNDGTKVLFTDEWGGGSRPRCRAQDPQNWGANAFYDIVNGKLEFRSHYKLPVAQTDQENCVAHNGSIIPVPGRDIFVQAWYQGGLSIIDFTDSAQPAEIAYFDRGPISDEHLVTGGYWSTYWYDGRIYGTEITRGLDVFTLQPSDHLSANEIAAAALADQGDSFNPQQQYPVTWPAVPVVALAYVDQLERAGALPAASITALSSALNEAGGVIDGGRRDPQLAARIEGLGAALPLNADDASTSRRATALQATLTGIAATLRNGN